MAAIKKISRRRQEKSVLMAAMVLMLLIKNKGELHEEKGGA
ncbi:hypothetical protein ACFO9Q_07160 [Paenibacillus sp. GCM10023252]